jgi:hypothetical protein
MTQLQSELFENEEICHQLISSHQPTQSLLIKLSQVCNHISFYVFKSMVRSAVALRPAKSKFDRATRDIIRDRESTRFQVIVEGQLQMMDENGLRVCVGARK